MPTAFHRLKTLFYTSEAMMNYGSKRTIVFVILQMRLALLMLKCDRVEYSNPVVDFFSSMWNSDFVSNIHNYAYQTFIWKDSSPVPGVSRLGSLLKVSYRAEKLSFEKLCKSSLSLRNTLLIVLPSWHCL
jgi:hypothetical protein